MIVLFAICFFGIAFCIIYEIIHRNKKGKYHKQKDENEKLPSPILFITSQNPTLVNNSSANLSNEKNKPPLVITSPNPTQMYNCYDNMNDEKKRIGKNFTFQKFSITFEK